MNPVDPNWIETQHRSFLNWTNSQLRNKHVQLTNLTEDLKSGVHLLELLSELLHTPIHIPITNPQFRIQMMNNLTEALEIIRKDCDISLINIDSNDIVDGNTKLVLALIHSLMYKYQVCKAMSDDRNVIDKNTPMTVVEKQLIDWLNSILYNSQPVITNITNDWTNGEHLKNLVHYFLPHNFEQVFESLNSMNPTEKIAECIKLADQELKIPKILEAQDISNAQQVPPPPIQVETKPISQPTVSSMNFDDISSAPPLSPPSIDEQKFNYQQQPPVQNWNLQPSQPVQPVQYYPQSHQQSLTKSTYLPDQSNQANSHISSLYSPGNSNSVQLIPQIPSPNQQVYGQENNHQSLMVPPPLMPTQSLQPYMDPYQQFNGIPTQHMMMMNQYSPQMQPPPQMPPQQQRQPMIITTTTTTNNHQVFTSDNMQYGYYQQQFY
ncbi:calponin homology domain-containing protein [Naegleria gruberi]|uniref:Calponin homology domain-containing protein n=1 Tax=Naegleria gruberi TaxID=5762 RepID=D2VF94_NAEGR|nr:calponin homology domain-containing protein [Naegleria gruberi]EFC44329.1 calponin homology domain-containing protein [Naegleria gruberi]|eukprot:XP_002677073.1 calponin homology domain-containing protein [Naegleria gruberi strain NEG-M]